ncbi:MAG: hypothetical protein KJO09_07405 [Gammaproteobacteria bacterium]|nr:hypothetical protein [Gammaproteobacteria bacterium]
MDCFLRRAVLWRNSRIDREIQKTLEDLRALVGQLQAKDRVKEAYAERPLLRADKLLRTLGKVIDRPVVLPAE